MITHIEHEARVSKIGEEQLFYLMSRGLSEEEASTMIVNGFIEPLVKELPMEYAVEMNRPHPTSNGRFNRLNGYRLSVISWNQHRMRVWHSAG